MLLRCNFSVFTQIEKRNSNFSKMDSIHRCSFTSQEESPQRKIWVLGQQKRTLYYGAGRQLMPCSREERVLIEFGSLSFQADADMLLAISNKLITNLGSEPRIEVTASMYNLCQARGIDPNFSLRAVVTSPVLVAASSKFEGGTCNGLLHALSELSSGRPAAPTPALHAGRSSPSFSNVIG